VGVITNAAQQLNLAIEVQNFLQQILKTKVRQGVVERKSNPKRWSWNDCRY
jgi:hypothetical protein